MKTPKNLRYWIGLAAVLTAVLALAGLVSARPEAAVASADSPAILGPYVGQPVYPAVFNGDLRDLPQLADDDPRGPIPLRYTPGNAPKGSAPQLAGWVDPVLQDRDGAGQMPDPIENYAGLDSANFGAGWPPDTNGDVGPDHYIQLVNTSIGIYDKDTGTRLVGLDLDTFFTSGSACNSFNQGDPVVLYDPQVDRWVVTDFAWINFNTGPFYECIAVSQTGDPVGGGWYFYQLQADTAPLTGYLNDYPKLGVWADGWYMSANMFQIVAPGTGFAVRVWALDRDSMIGGGALNEVHFDCTGAGCDSLLPANIRGDLPPAGAPEYFGSVEAPTGFNIWEFHVDWDTPGNSTFTGPVDLEIAEFAVAQSVPQLGSSELLDSLSPRLMMQLQYRNINGRESLWANHTVAGSEGIGGVRWYEIQDPGGSPFLAQQGTYQPDEHHRWMGSVAVDQDGNMAIGYSVSSSTMRPAIRYAGRLNGELPGEITQGEAVLIQGTGSQSGGFSRWGDYSAMTVDPTDDCTFWYTTEYYITTGSNWQTRIGSFKYPSCGQPKGFIEGHVYNAVTNDPVEGATVMAESTDQTLSVLTDASGYYTMTLTAGDFDVQALPLLPGYPVSSTVEAATVSVGSSTNVDLYLSPVPYLVEGTNTIDDSLYGNGNGYPEPGEQGLLLWEGLYNSGAITATNVSAHLMGLTAGVTVSEAHADYPDIGASQTGVSLTPYTFSIDPSVACGADLEFEKEATADEGTYTINFSLDASVPVAREEIFNNDVEGGAAGWTTGGTSNLWAITELQAHSPTHSWTDSPSGNYPNNMNSYLRSPAYNLSGKYGVELRGWFRWDLEAGYDYAYVDYSLNGGSTWSSDANALHVFNSSSDGAFEEVVMDASVLDNQSNVAIRFRVVTDGSVVFDGIYVDDIVMDYQPIVCDYEPPAAPSAPNLISPADDSTVNGPDVTFIWADSGAGGAPSNYVFNLDGSAYMTFTGAITSTTISLSEGAHTWSVTASNISGSATSAEWTVNVVNQQYIYLPLIRRP